MKRGVGDKGKRKKGYYFARYGPGLRGHSWQGHGKERKCSRCGASPRNQTLLC